MANTAASVNPARRSLQPVNTRALGKHIRAVRIEKGWTMLQLALLSGLSVGAIYKAETGKRISVSTRRKIVAIVGEPHERRSHD